MHTLHGRKRFYFLPPKYPRRTEVLPMNKVAFATLIYGFILLTFGALFAYSALLWREFLAQGSELAATAPSVQHPRRPVFSMPRVDASAIHTVQDRLQVYRTQLVIQLRRVQLDKKTEDEATKGNIYQIPTRKNRRRPKNLPGPKGICNLPELRVFQKGDEPFRSQGSDMYFPESPSITFNSCAVVSNAGSLLRSNLGMEIDSHDAVLRFNNAPAGGIYTEDVGSKTTHRILNSQVVSKPEFDFFESPLYRNVTLLVWDASKYREALESWLDKPEHDVFAPYFLRRQIIPDENLHLIDPRSLWKIWDFLDNFSNLPVIKNPPSSGLLGLAFFLRQCNYLDFYEYIPSMRLTRRCHYYSEHEDMGCTTGVWHPLASEKLLVLDMTTSSNKDIFATGKVSFSRKDFCKN